MIQKLGFTGGTVGAVYATMGMASLFMPALLGIVADRWVNSERLLGICHILGAVFLYIALSFFRQQKLFLRIYTAIFLHAIRLF